MVTGSDTGNLIIRFHGSDKVEGVFFCCHMDTVEPGDHVKVVRTGNIFTSNGETVLGGDDKSGIAALLELMTVIKENKLAHGLIEIVLTTCEEIGLKGAKALDCSRIEAPYGYALDSTGIDTVITGAPAANKFRIDIHGHAAHAGLNPEDGVSAVQIAANAISKLHLGRIDEETTCNIGVIQGGVATNIVPALATVKGEIRSHSPEKLELYTKKVKSAFREAVDEWQRSSAHHPKKPTLQIDMAAEYPAMRLESDSPVIQRLHSAEKKIGRQLTYIVAGGGSDANIINGHGLPTAILATGMDKVHTTDEQLNLNDLVRITELLLGIAVEG